MHSCYYPQSEDAGAHSGFAVMITAILALLWRQIPSVCELTKTLNREGALMDGSSESLATCIEQTATHVSGRAVSKGIVQLATRVAESAGRAANARYLSALSVLRRTSRTSMRWMVRPWKPCFAKLKALKDTSEGALGRQDLHGDRPVHASAGANLVHQRSVGPRYRL